MNGEDKNIPSLYKVRLEGFLWFHLKEYLVSFKPKRLSKDLHFTVVFDDRKQDIDFHITKNSGAKRKPKIRIVLIDKDFLVALSLAYLVRRLSLLEISDLQTYEGYIAPRKLMEDEQFKSLDAKLKGKATLENVYRLRGKNSGTIEIKKEILSLLQEPDFSEEAIKLIYNHMVEVPHTKVEGVEGGFLITKDRKCVPVIRIGECWYQILFPESEKDFFEALLGPSLASRVQEKVGEALELMKGADSYEDVRAYDTPIRIDMDSVG